jgi:hypothetical protein
MQIGQAFIDQVGSVGCDHEVSPMLQAGDCTFSMIENLNSEAKGDLLGPSSTRPSS